MDNIFLGLGSNIGNREENILHAIGEIDDIAIIEDVSEFINSEPWGEIDQPTFLNTVIKISTDLSPQELLEKTQKIEKKLGRKSRKKWGPREIDIDILFWNQDSITEEKLHIPHKYWKQRNFVLQPMLQIAPDFSPPDSEKTIEEICETKKECQKREYKMCNSEESEE